MSQPPPATMRSRRAPLTLIMLGAFLLLLPIGLGLTIGRLILGEQGPYPDQLETVVLTEQSQVSATQRSQLYTAQKSAELVAVPTVEYRMIGTGDPVPACTITDGAGSSVGVLDGVGYRWAAEYQSNYQLTCDPPVDGLRIHEWDIYHRWVTRMPIASTVYTVGFFLCPVALIVLIVGIVLNARAGAQRRRALGPNRPATRFALFVVATVLGALLPAVAFFATGIAGQVPVSTRTFTLALLGSSVLLIGLGLLAGLGRSRILARDDEMLALVAANRSGAEQAWAGHHPQGQPPQPGPAHQGYPPQPGPAHQGYPGQPGHPPQPGPTHQGYPPQPGPTHQGYPPQPGPTHQGYPGQPGHPSQPGQSAQSGPPRQQGHPPHSGHHNDQAPPPPGWSRPDQFR